MGEQDPPRGRQGGRGGGGLRPRGRAVVKDEVRGSAMEENWARPRPTLHQRKKGTEKSPQEIEESSGTAPEEQQEGCLSAMGGVRSQRGNRWPKDISGKGVSAGL